MITSVFQVANITNLTLREAWRKRLVWIAGGLGGAFCALFGIGYYFICQEVRREAGTVFSADQIIQQSSGPFLSAGLYVVNFLVVMLTVLTAVGVISAEVTSGTMHTLASKPIRRWEIVLGKWIGLAVMLSTYTLVLSTILILLVRLISGYEAYQPAQALAVLVLEGLAVLSVTVLGSTLFSTLANGVVVFMLYGVAFVGGWVEQIGVIVRSQTAKDLGIASSLLMPSEALWRYAASLLQRPGLLASVTPFSAASTPTPAFLIYALIYVIGMLFAAMAVFSRKDL
jgi:ABC-type transport system involved in multi-copper enzyme maturation permease subunit